MSQPTVIHARSTRSAAGRLRPVFYVPLALFVSSIIGGLAVLVGELPTPIF